MDLTGPMYVLIQHTNALYQANQMSFVPASCDFTDFYSVDNSFGKRPHCYPLRYDHDYPNLSSTNAYSGSGFFFNINELLSNKVYILRIWLFADNCGGNGITNFNAVSNDANSSVTFSFTLTVFKTIHPELLNENRLTDLIAFSPPKELASKCWNSKVHTYNFNSVPSSNSSFSSLFFNGSSNVLNLLLKVAVNTNSDYLLFKEVYDWSAMAQNTLSPSASDYVVNITGSTTFTESYLYTTSNSTPLNNSYFLIKGGFHPYTGATILQMMALPYSDTGHTTNKFSFTESKSIFLFSKDWFTKGDDMTSTNGCYVSWGWSGGSSISLAAQNTWNVLVFDAYNSGHITYTDANSGTSDPGGVKQIDIGDIFVANQNNFISSRFNSNIPGTFYSQSPTIDANNSYVSTTGSLKIVSTPLGVRLPNDYLSSNIYNAYTTPTPTAPATLSASNIPRITWSPVPMSTTDVSSTSSEEYLTIFSSCIRWKSNFPTVTSLYTSIEFYWNFSYNDKVNRVNRFIKLYPEAGVMQGKEKIYLTGIYKNPLQIHYTYITSTQRAVCLLEIDGSTLVTLANSTSNTFLLWLYYGTLFETDYSDASATYPVAPLPNTVNSYSLTGGVPQSN
jgi:hypothetical protein